MGQQPRQSFSLASGLPTCFSGWQVTTSPGEGTGPIVCSSRAGWRHS